MDIISFITGALMDGYFWLGLIAGIPAGAWLMLQGETKPHA